MKPPAAPQLETYGLTEVEVATLHRFWFPSVSSEEALPDDAARVVRYLQPSRIAVVAGVVTATGRLTNLYVENGGSIGAILVGLFSAIPLGILGAIVGAIAAATVVRPLYIAVACVTMPAFRRYLALRHAIASYVAQRKEYDLWRLRTEVEFWRALPGITFEREVASLYKRLGYQVVLTPGTSDGGIDIVLRRGDETTAVQCKAYRGKVGISVARELVTAARDIGANRMMIACTTGASPQLHAYALEKGIEIVTAEHLVKMQADLDGMPVAHLTLERPDAIAARLRAVKRSRRG